MGSAALMSYVSGPSDQPLIGRTIGEELDRVAEEHGSNLAIVSRHQGQRYTYEELHELVERAARAFLSLGVRKGDRVGIWSPNRTEWVVVQYATAKIGAILVTVNPGYKRNELQYALEQSGVSRLVCATGFGDSDYLQMIADVRSELPDLRNVVVLGEPDEGNESWDAFLERASNCSVDELREREATLSFDDPINIQYTSGTTGAPKGATLSHHNILNNAFFVGEGCRYTPDDIICAPVPLYHTFGMVMANLGALTHGSAVVYPAERFEPVPTLEAVQEEKCTSLYGVPTMFTAQLEHADFEKYDLSSLRTGIMAGSSCPIELMKQAIDRMHMPEITICYGQTETSPVSFQTLPDDDMEHRTETVGAIHPWVQAKVIDPDTGLILPRGEKGELCVRGYLVMLGYWNMDKRTDEAIDQANWMHSGDLAVMREDGYVNIVGRIKDMIIRGGENIYPREIEEFLLTHPKIAAAAVIGVPDKRYGEEVAAWLQLKDGEEATEEEIQEYAEGEISTNKIPRYIKFVDEFPLTVTGKIRKVEMREQYAEELGLEEIGDTA